METTAHPNALQTERGAGVLLYAFRAVLRAGVGRWSIRSKCFAVCPVPRARARGGSRGQRVTERGHTKNK